MVKMDISQRIWNKTEGDQVATPIVRTLVYLDLVYIYI